jgi:hypothetical protein
MRPFGNQRGASAGIDAAEKSAMTEGKQAS